MAQRGRPRKANHVKELQGTINKDRVIDNAVTFVPLTDIPKPTQELQKPGEDFYYFCCRALMSRRLLTAVDILEVQGAAMWYGIQYEAYEMVKLKGPIQETQTGHGTVSGWFSVLRDSRKALSEFYNKYGFNLTSRQRIEMPEVLGDDDLTKLKNE